MLCLELAIVIALHTEGTLNSLFINIYTFVNTLLPISSYAENSSIG